MASPHGPPYYLTFNGKKYHPSIEWNDEEGLLQNPSTHAPHSSKKDFKGLLGVMPPRVKSKNVLLMWLYTNIDKCETIATGTWMFMLLFIETLLCPDLGSIVWMYEYFGVGPQLWEDVDDMFPRFLRWLPKYRLLVPPKRSLQVWRMVIDGLATDDGYSADITRALASSSGEESPPSNAGGPSSLFMETYPHFLAWQYEVGVDLVEESIWMIGGLQLVVHTQSSQYVLNEVNLFDTTELCSTIEEFFAILGYEPRKKSVAVSCDPKYREILSDALGLSTLVSSSMIEGYIVNLQAVVTRPIDKRTHSLFNNMQKNFGLALWFMGEFLLCSGRLGFIDARAIGIMSQVKNGDNPASLILAKTLLGLDYVFLGGESQQFLRSPLTL
ncbi:hypothetical protein SO802_017803 [Lithocarpus litseifolius]|uniref:Uncharacterized protein n=1 Tax=Lithocarpus litseifolius TaxID=425828 RepID=A0AAW2CMF2_9ROSI